MIGLIVFLFVSVPSSVPEDSNTQYVLDKQIAHYFEDWEVRYDSVTGGLRTSQGCLDLLNWYVDLDAKYDVVFGKVIGLRYRNRTYGDYGFNIHDHIFQPFFQLNPRTRLLLSIAPHYYKGEDELGLGLYLGKDYLNFFETMIIAEDFDRNFSLQHDPEGPDKITYHAFPIKCVGEIVLNWSTGRVDFNYDIAFNYRLQSTEPDTVEIRSYVETGRHDRANIRFWQDINSFRFGCLMDVRHELWTKQDTVTALDQESFEMIIEPMFAYRIGDRFFPHLYITYNYKILDDSVYRYASADDSLFHYYRSAFAGLFDFEWHPGGNFIWHAGIQQAHTYTNQGRDFWDRRLNIGIEYRYKNVWFYLIEAMEGDFPTPKYMHNHTYIQLLLKF